MGPYPWLVENAVRVAYTPAQTITLPYSFAPLPIGTPEHTIPALNLASVEFVNSMGSYALTLYSILDKLAILGIFVVLILAVRAVWWLYGFVTGLPSSAPALDVSGGIDTYFSTGNRMLQNDIDVMEEWADEANSPEYAKMYRNTAAGLRSDKQFNSRRNTAWKKIIKFGFGGKR